MVGLRENRIAKGLSQSELAKAVGVTQTTISLLETADILPGEDLRRRLDGVLDTRKGSVKMTQNEKVLQYMRTHGKISQRDAVQFGCYRLSARIHNLREAGYRITSHSKGFSNEYGHGSYAEYSLVEE